MLSLDRLELSFPTVALHFNGGAEMIQMPRNYLSRSSLLVSLFNYLLPSSITALIVDSCSISPSSPFVDLSDTDIVLMDKLIVHDFENMRLGWVNFNCELISFSSAAPRS
jgi:hypothetical protein